MGIAKDYLLPMSREWGYYQLSNSKLFYRPEIDGLRAVAVISVILYHAKIVLTGKEWFEGGYIGVDVFFVISGYLITRIILLELLQTGSLNFIRFYERRARRILPMLLVVIFVSIPFAWQKLFPLALVEYTESILSALIFGSNFFFYYSTTEYGADSALLKPFLHTWSLGVEEQFYLVFPVLAIMIFRTAPKYVLTAIVILSLISLLFSNIMEDRNSDLNFYLPFSRFWELSVGSFLAFRELNHKCERNRYYQNILPIIGLSLVVYSVLFFDSKTPHPSYYTIVPVMGVALIIGFSTQRELVGKVLGSRPFVWVGLISYSLYLWHFPIFAFSRMGGEVANYTKFNWIILTILLSVLSYYVIERPFRNRSIVSYKFLLGFLIGSFALLIALALMVFDSGGYPQRFPKMDGFGNYEVDNEKLRKNSWKLLEVRESVNPKFFNVKNKVLIVGNSHAKDLFNALELHKNSLPAFDFLRGSLPQLDCANESVKEYAAVRQGFYTSEQYKSATAIIVSTRYNHSVCMKTKKASQSNDLKGLDDLITKAQSDGKLVIVMANTPEFKAYNKKWVSDYIYDKYRQDTDLAYEFKYQQVQYEAGKLLFSQLDKEKIKQNGRVKEIALNKGVIYWDKVPLICNVKSKSCSAFTDEGYKTFYDYGHWTIEGARYFGQKLLKSGFLMAFE